MNITAKNIAIMKLETGPASATIHKLFLPLLRFSTITGTGFAQPIPIKRIASVPIKSRCLTYKLNFNYSGHIKIEGIKILNDSENYYKNR